jgi:hypothetical protein
MNNSVGSGVIIDQAESTAKASATSRDARDHPIRSRAPLLWALLT